MRQMRLLLFFDLPVETRDERRAYSRFRKNLIKDGFMMLQKSVYCKLLTNASAVDASVQRIERYKPEGGMIDILVITERQFVKMRSLLDPFKTDVIHDTNRTVLL